VIVGFPGETEAEFMETYQYLNELDVAYLHVFTYSERPNTPAHDMQGAVPAKVRHARSKMLRTLSVKKRRYFYSQHLHDTHSVLFEDDVANGMIHGFTENYIRVAAPENRALINTMCRVKLKSLDADGGVLGSIIEEELAATF
jgi:threonylcarbamoyladenosine tRNA methylthiotransferase MtaB